MDTYEQAGRIVQQCLGRKGSVKSLCLRKDVQKKKLTFALVSETIRYHKLIDAILRDSGAAETVTQYRNKRNMDCFRGMLQVFVYELLLGKRFKTQSGLSAALKRQLPALRHSYANLKELPEYAPEPDPREKEALEPNANVRVNYLKESRSRDHFLKEFNATADVLFPDLFAVSSRSVLAGHALVSKGKLIVQSRSSCLPAHCVLDAVHDFRNVVDACSSPGNKTTHLCALYAERHKQSNTSLRVIAIEKDKQRFETLRDRVQHLGASPFVTCLHGDFFDFHWAGAEVIICDPSCSANRPIETERLVSLVSFQVRLLAHALLDFPGAKCVSYSTCSANPLENEFVVAIALEIATSQGWTLHHALESWDIRGDALDSTLWKEYYQKCYPKEKNGYRRDTPEIPSCLVEQGAEKCLRNTEPHPFFVAVFVRTIQSE